ncbi:MAG: hypothetical protein NTY43_09050, partial [Bacteroidetes bacterium]|nr:hypothetical protein [Bacteroidota bacterium]
MKLFFISILMVFCSIGLQAQNILNSKDLSAFKADALTESDISQIQKDLKSKGVTIDQLQEQAVAKGMPMAEFTKLKTRLNSNTTAGRKKTSPLIQLDKNKTVNTFTTDSMLLDGMEKKLNPLIYGSELFSNSSAGFAENQNIATPLNYIVGPNDVLKLVVYG